MASDSLIVAHNNIFNNSVLSNNAFYFEDSDDIKNILTKESVSQDIRNKMIAANKNRIAESHSWEFIANQHETLFFDLLKRNGKNN